MARETRQGGRISRLVEGLVTLALVAHLVRFAILVSARAFDPWPLDWVEGMPVLHALSILRGFPAYHAPGPEAMPIVYGPGMAALLLPFYAMGATGLWPGRLLAALSTLGAAGLSYALVRRDGARRAEAMVAPLLLFSCQAATDHVHDMARIDAPAYFFLVAGLWFTFGPGKSRRSQGIAIACMLVATFIKQSLGLAVLAAFVARSLRRPAEGLRLVAAYLGLGAFAAGLLQLWGGGWFYYWAFGLMARHPWKDEGIQVLVQDLLAGTHGAFLLLLLVLLAVGVRCPRRAGRTGLGLPLVGSACVLLGALSRIKMGGHINGWLYAFGLLGMVAAVAPVRLRTAWPGWRSGGLAMGMSYLVAVFALQVAWTTRSHPRHLSRGASEIQQSERYFTLIREFSGPVFAPVLPAVSELAGGGPQISLMTLWDLGYASEPAPPPALVQRLETGRYEAVLLPKDYAGYFPGLELGYVPAWDIPIPRMVVGNELPPMTLWLPRRPDQQPVGPGLANIEGERQPGTLRATPDFEVSTGALLVRVEGGGDSDLEHLALLVDGVVRRKTATRLEQAPTWILWDLREFVGESVRVEIMARDPDGDLRLIEACFTDLPRVWSGT